MVEQAIEHRGDRGGVAEQPSPVVDGPVRGEQRARPLVAAHDQLEQIFGRAGRKLAHAEVVENEQRHARQFGEVVLARAEMPGLQLSQDPFADSRVADFDEAADIVRVCRR